MKSNLINHKNRALTNGFTLIEVIIALMVLAISLGAAYALFNNSIKINSKLDQKMFAEWSIHNYSQLQQTVDWSKINQQTADLKNGPYAFQVKVVALKTSDPNFKKLKIRLYDAISKQELSSLTTYWALNARW